MANLTTALRAAELLTRLLPVGAQYALADLAGDLWHRLSPRRRRLVTRNLARVCGDPDGRRASPQLRRLVRQAFREHARYYLEILRVPNYPTERIERIVSLPEWPELEPIYRAGPVILVGAHLGNFEPVGHWLARHGLRGVAPVEEIEPRELFEFLLARRGGNRAGVEAIPLSRARHRLVTAIRNGECVALLADRDLDRTGPVVEFFGHPAPMPSGPAALAVLTGAPVVTGRSYRVGPDRFEMGARVLEYQKTGDRSHDVAVLSAAILRDLEGYIRQHPEQWFASFQQIWPDISA